MFLKLPPSNTVRVCAQAPKMVPLLHQLVWKISSVIELKKNQVQMGN